jgi:hypothetical protein
LPPAGSAEAIAGDRFAAGGAQGRQRDVENGAWDSCGETVAGAQGAAEPAVRLR